MVKMYKISLIIICYQTLAKILYIPKFLDDFLHLDDTYLSFKVGTDPDNTSLDSHLEGEADDPPNLQQRLLAKAPSSLTTDRKQTKGIRRHTKQGQRGHELRNDCDFKKKVHYTELD